MENLGEILRKLRKEKKLPLRIVAAYLDVDQAILSKIERGHRKATRQLVVKLAAYFNVEEENLLVAWLSDKLVYEVGEEKVALKALQVAEERVEYQLFKKTNKDDILKKIKELLIKINAIKKAWIYGSFSRGDDTHKSDVDIAIETEGKFSYFDMAEVQYLLEKAIKRKVDIGFINTFKPHIFEHVKPDLKLIYER